MTQRELGLAAGTSHAGASPSGVWTATFSYGYPRSRGLSQNHPLHNREAVIARLAEQASDNARDVARLMRDTLAQDD